MSASSTDLFLSDPKMSDLANVKHTKAMGYLPLKTIREAGYDKDQVAALLRKQGLGVIIYEIPESPADIYIHNVATGKYIRGSDKKKFDEIPPNHDCALGSLVAYDREAVQLFLDQNREALTVTTTILCCIKSRKIWPTSAAEFVDKVMRNHARDNTPLRKLIDRMFTSMPNRQELKFNSSQKG